MNALEQTLLITVIQGLFVAGAAFYFNKKLESFKHDLLHKVNARKILIEKELEFYSQLFKVLTDLRSVVAELTRFTIRKPAGETHLEWNRKIYDKAVAPFNELYDLTGSYRPFYPESLYPKIDELVDLTNKLLNRQETVIGEMVESQRDNLVNSDLLSSIEGISEEIKEKSAALIGEVRDRINQMS